MVDSNLQASMDAVKKQNDDRWAKIKDKFRDDPTQFEHDVYLRYDDQVAWVQAAAAASSSIANTFTVGSSYEGRNIIGLRINQGTNLPGYYVDCNIHAREWITSSSCMYIVDEILTGTSADAAYLRTSFRWYFVINLNPDGYEFCHTNDRMWRKTRSDNAGSTCVGTDPNRNWDANWGGEGASPSPCSDTYRGTSPFSEAETSSARDFLLTIADHTDIFVSVHAYSQYWLVPWGGTDVKPPDYPELKRVGDAVGAAIEGVNGLNFVVGTPPDILYVASGGSFDWAKLENGMTYAYSPELRPGPNDPLGFQLPPTHILPSGREIFAGFVALGREVQAIKAEQSK